MNKNGQAEIQTIIGSIVSIFILIVFISAMVPVFQSLTGTDDKQAEINKLINENTALKQEISNTYHSWRGELINGKKVEYKDILGFCKSAKLEEVEKDNFILTPGRYVGAEEEEEDTEKFEEKMKRMTAELSEQMKEGRKLDEEIKKNLGSIGFKV